MSLPWAPTCGALLAAIDAAWPPHGDAARMQLHALARMLVEGAHGGTPADSLDPAAPAVAPGAAGCYSACIGELGSRLGVWRKAALRKGGGARACAALRAESCGSHAGQPAQSSCRFELQAAMRPLRWFFKPHGASHLQAPACRL